MRDPEWANYVREFYGERARITDAVLGGASGGDANPGQGVAEPLGSNGIVVDLA